MKYLNIPSDFCTSLKYIKLLYETKSFALIEISEMNKK